MKNNHYNSKNHINNLVDVGYYRNLMSLRNTLSLAFDNYFQSKQAPKVDLYMIAKGISSPMGKGSDSEPIPFDLGDQHVYLADSAQFGMEPLVQKAFEMVYCYLPSFRGEDSDYRHLNQFYHCESEIRGELNDAMNIAETMVKFAIHQVLEAYQQKAFSFENANFELLSDQINCDFERLTFNEGAKLLEKNGFSSLIEVHDYGRVISTQGELELSQLVNKGKSPFWLTHYDRDVVPFYQKPAEDPNQVLNADLIFPSINRSFGGEILGLGQRQDNKDEMLESMHRQGVNNPDSYQWYLDLRERDDYQTTSGFGLGVERLLAWMLNLESIIDTAIYPVMKDEKIYY